MISNIKYYVVTLILISTLILPFSCKNSSVGNDPNEASLNLPKIIFESKHDGIKDIFIMNGDGSNQINLTNNSSTDIRPQIFLDNSRIIFVTNRNGKNDIYIMNIDGSNQVNLSNNNSTDSQPHISPDGKKVVFVSNRDGNNEIYVMNVDGSNLINITKDTFLQSNAMFLNIF